MWRVTRAPFEPEWVRLCRVDEKQPEDENEPRSRVGTGVNQCGRKKTAQLTLRLVDWQACLWGLGSGRGRLFMRTATTPRGLLPESAGY